MFDTNQIVEGVVWLFVLMLPALGVVALFAAAHLVGGALKGPNRNAAGQGDSRLRNSPDGDFVPHQRMRIDQHANSATKDVHDAA